MVTLGVSVTKQTTDLWSCKGTTADVPEKPNQNDLGTLIQEAETNLAAA